MRAPDRLVGGVAAVAAAWAVTVLSHVPMGSATSDAGTLRLGWRARPERIETCQALDDEALASVPRHMRQSVVCEGKNASYRLDVAVNGRPAAERLVEAGGLRHDRPLYVFLEVEVPTGDVDVAVRFTRIDPAGDGSAPGAVAGAGAGDAPGAAPDATPGTALAPPAASREQLLEAVPPVLVFERRLNFAPRQVRLVSYDPRQQELVEIARGRPIE